MSFKTFISHKREDAISATMLKMTLEAKGLATYVDVFDPDSQDGPALGDYLRRKLGECNGLIAVVSAATSASWWVPWEIGVATERDMPLATYSRDRSSVPSYLKKWPYMTTISEVEAYAAEVQQQLARRRQLVVEGRVQKSAENAISGRDFNRALRVRLRQG